MSATKQTGIPEMTEEAKTAFYIGQFQMCDALLRSPLMNRPQREVIENAAYRVMEELKERGVEFSDKETGAPA